MKNNSIMNKSLVCDNPKNCGTSSDITDNPTFGWGHLSEMGYFEHECGACEKSWYDEVNARVAEIEEAIKDGF